MSIRKSRFFQGFVREASVSPELQKIAISMRLQTGEIMKGIKKTVPIKGTKSLIPPAG